MDGKDEKILDYLKENGRAAFTEIAEELDVSEGTVRNRVQKLKEEGIIERFTVDVKAEGTVKAFVSVNVSTERNFQDLLEELPEDLKIFEIAGDMDLLVKISRTSSEQVNEVVDRIRAIPGVRDTKTYMVLSEK